MIINQPRTNIRLLKLVHSKVLMFRRNKVPLMNVWFLR